MRKVLLLILIIISVQSFGQPPSNYTYINGRYRWQSTMADSGSHVARYNGIPSGLRVGMSPNAGAVAADTLNHGFFLYSGQLWRKVGTDNVKCGLTCSNCGLVVWSGTGLVFEVTAADYNLNGQSYHYAGGNVTLDAADGTFDRFDAIVLTSSGLSKVTGTASSDPQLPQFDPCASVLLTYVFVQTGATTPVLVSDELIYDEDAETWTHSTSGTISANFASTVTSSVGTKSIAIASWSNNANIIFTAPSTLTASNYTTFSFYLKLGTTMTTQQNISVQFFNGTTAVSNIVPAPFTKSYTSSFQGAVMSMSQFTFTNSSFTNIKLIFSGSNANTVYIDFIRLQSGVTQPPPPSQTYTARLPIRITGTVISADTSTAFVPSLTTNGRLLKVADSIRVAALTGSSLTATYVGYGSGSNTLTGEAAFSYNATDNILDVYTAKVNNFLMTDFNSIGTPPTGYTGIYSDSHGRVYSKNDAGTIVELTNDAGGSGTINSGTTGKPAYYVGATTLDDFAAIDYATSGTHALITAQAATDIPLDVKAASLQSADIFRLSTSASSGGRLKVTAGGEWLFNGISDAGVYTIQLDGAGIYAEDIPSNENALFATPSAGSTEYFAIQNGGGTKWSILAGGSMDLVLGTSNDDIILTPDFVETARFPPGGGLRVTETAAPGTPASGNAIMYVKSDGLFYGKDDAGVETQLSNAGGGALTLQQVTDAGNVTTRAVQASSIHVKAENGLGFNIDSTGNIITSGYGAVMGVNNTTKRTYITNSVYGHAGTAANYANNNIELDSAGGVIFPGYGNAFFSDAPTNDLMVSSSGYILDQSSQVTLTESAATTFYSASVGSGAMAGGEVVVTVEATEFTDYQARTLRFIWSAVNKAGTITVTISTPEEVVSVSTGTLTCTITAVDGGSNVVNFKADATSSLSQTVLACKYRVKRNF